MRHLGKRWWHPANCCRKHIQEIVSKSRIKASCPGSRKRAEAGQVGGLNQRGMRGGSACGPTLCQGLSPQKGPSEDRHALHLIVWEGIHFCLWHVLEHQASTIFCGRLIPLQPDYSLARRGLPQRQVSSRETQLDPYSLLYRLMKQPEMSSLNSMCGIWTMLPSETPPERVHDDLVVLLERLRAIGLEVNGSKCEFTILNDSMPEATDSLFRGLLPGVRVVEACDLSLVGAQWIYKAFQEQSMRKGKRLRGWHQSWRCWTHIMHLFCWRMPLRYQSCNMYWEHRSLTCVDRSWAPLTGLFFIL